MTTRVSTRVYPSPEIFGINLNARHMGYVSAKYAQMLDGIEERKSWADRCVQIETGFAKRYAAVLRKNPNSRVLPVLLL